MKTWQKIALGVGGLFAGAAVLKGVTQGWGAVAATPHGGTVGANGTTQTQSNSGTGGVNVVNSLVSGALTGAGFLGAQKAIGALTSGAPNADAATGAGAGAEETLPEATASATDTSLVPAQGSAAEVAGGGTAAAEAGSVAEGTSIMAEVEAIGPELLGAVEAAPELALLAL